MPKVENYHSGGRKTSIWGPIEPKSSFWMDANPMYRRGILGSGGRKTSIWGPIELKSSFWMDANPMYRRGISDSETTNLGVKNDEKDIPEVKKVDL